MPPPHDRADPRAWCAVAVARLSRDQPEAALEAARQAVGRDPDGEWGHRLASLALERLGRDSEAVASAREAVRLAPGSWAARLRLGGALRRVPGRWRDAWAEARKAVRFAPDEPDAHVLAGDLALLRGEQDRAARSYELALRRTPDHPGARINLGLTLLRWERPRAHHDPAWDVDPRETGRARHAVEVWSRQVRVLLAAALTAVSVAGLGLGLHREAQLGGAVVLGAVLAITIRQAGRVRAWPYVPAMLGRDLWLSMSVSVTLMAIAAYVAGLATLPPVTPASLEEAAGGVWAGALGLVLFNGVAVAVVRLLAEAWRGRPLRALGHFAAVPADRTALRDIDVTLWIVAGRVWWLTVLAALLPLTGEPRTALAALAVLGGLLYARRRLARRTGGRRALRLGPFLRADRWLAVAFLALLVAIACLTVAGMAGAGMAGAGVSPTAGTTAAGAVQDGGRTAGEAAWDVVERSSLLGSWGSLALVGLAFGARAARAWWRGGAGPWRASLVLSEARGPRLPGDMSPSTGLSDEVRHAATYSRSVVLAYTEPDGPRALAVSAVTSVSASGEFRLIAGDEAWDAVERDPRVVLFVGDPRFWAEVRGVAVPDNDVLRITPRRVLMREYPGRHQARSR
ncbi:tetratricopeptide repeat protein [Planotetraspora sp. GP83]|uniref:tetratricopeptide repeat protein n=1 Tax=Planotetraspora sp. GP83 TaxID=3156264 RepID=UPI003518DF99